MRTSSSRLLLGAWVLLAGGGAMAGGQTAARLSPAEMPLPDAPESAPAPVAYSTSLPGLPGGQTAVTSAAPQADGEGQQTKRILGIIPNFRSVSVDQKLPPMPVKEKFIEASQDSFDYSSIFLPAAIGGYSDARRATPEFGHGAIAYGRYFWHSAADQTIENYMVEFVGPALTHQDPRYYTKGRGGFVKRTEYSLSRVVITRTDDDRETFNSSEVFGALAAAGISNAYYPSPERGFGKTMGTFGTSVAIDAATFMFHEFWPDINQRFFHMKD